MTVHMKDAVLDRLARHANVAQFVSFGPDLGVRRARIRGWPSGHCFASTGKAVEAILAASPEGRANLRSFEPENPKSREFLYARSSVGEILADLGRLASQGLFTIVNETLDVDDGGVSGVAFGEVVEFAPGDTPRCVEKAGTCSLPRAYAMRLFEIVYGFVPSLPFPPSLRVEFSLHPAPRGCRQEHTVIWEVEPLGSAPGEARLDWPNRFSCHVGDKVFGLLIADLAGLPVPRTQAIPRWLAPFCFGRDTGSAETWLRTCPREQVAGLFTTRRGWSDPFRLLAAEDPEGEAIAAVLAQQGVDARYSGAMMAGPPGEPLIEGVAGSGEGFMQGCRAPEVLPGGIVSDLVSLLRGALDVLGPVRCEWAHDGRRPWVLQLHRGTTESAGRTIYPGQAFGWRRFEVRRGLEALRAAIVDAKRTGEGIVLVGKVGLTSHFGDVLRKAQVPSVLESD